METQAENVTAPGTELIIPLMPERRPEGDGTGRLLIEVDQLLTKLWPDQEFRQYLDHITNKSAITGKWEVDRGFAAKRIQDEAQKENMVGVVGVKLAKIMRAIETLLRRDGLGRRQRLLAVMPPAPEATPAE